MKKALLQIIVAFCFFSCGKVPTSEPGLPISPFNENFDDAKINGVHYLVVDSVADLKLLNSPVRKGSCALKNILHPEDFVFNGYRTELAIYDCAKYKSEAFYGFSFMIDTAYSDMRFNLLCQWQDLPYYIQGEWWEPTPTLHGSSPPLALVYADGNLELKINEDPSSDQHTVVISSIPSIEKGKWYDMVFHVYWSDENDGFIEAWVNGNFFTPYNGTNHKYYKRNLFNRTGNYFKFGQYRGHIKPIGVNAVYFDEIKIGSSYNDVAP